MESAYRSYLNLVRRHLGTRKNIDASLPYLKQFPELFDIHVGELTAVTRLFERYSQFETLRNSELYPNAEFLMKVLGREQLPPWAEIEQKLLAYDMNAGDDQFSAIFAEIGDFKFPDWENLTIIETLGTLFISLYRTYALHSRPHWRACGAMVGSTVAEMLALLALNGCRTHLFTAEKVWILHHEEEGFSNALAERVRSL